MATSVWARPYRRFVGAKSACATMSWRPVQLFKGLPLPCAFSARLPTFLSFDMCNGAIKLAETPFARC
jgi:hypothetical protein